MHETEISSPVHTRKCGEEFRSASGLFKQKRTHFGNAKVHKCDLCDKKCYDISALKQHYMIHTGEKPFEYETCDKRFNLKSTLVKHAKIHETGLPSPFKIRKCSECGKKFRSASGLLRHKKTHFGNAKVHKCDVCSKKFSEGASLKQHYLIHTGEKPFECETCSKQFNKKSSLVRHTKIHVPGLSSPIPIQVQKCSECGKEFKSISGMWKHKKNHFQNVKVHKYDLCGKKFCEKSVLAYWHHRSYRFGGF